ncbi:MAG: hypothetical protein ACO3GP_08010 [Candidatus Limnocylindrus sp.]
MPFFSEKFAATVAPKESAGNRYLNPSSIEDGGSARFAILSEEPLEGWEVWFTKAAGGMTKRITPEEPDDQLLAELEEEVCGSVTERDGRKAIKFCAAFFVYDYEDETVKIFSANQKSLLSDINRNVSDPDYADLSQWDMKVTRTGKGTDTKYAAMMVPTRRSNTKVAKAVIEAWDEVCEAGADLAALYDGGDPFTPQK